MPVKTKAQKLAADERREKIQYSYSASSSSAVSTQTTAVSADDYSYVVSDLRRIGIFTALAFGAEIILWYLLKVRS